MFRDAWDAVEITERAGNGVLHAHSSCIDPRVSRGIVRVLQRDAEGGQASIGVKAVLRMLGETIRFKLAGLGVAGDLSQWASGQGVPHLEVPARGGADSCEGSSEEGSVEDGSRIVC